MPVEAIPLKGESNEDPVASWRVCVRAAVEARTEGNCCRAQLLRSAPAGFVKPGMVESVERGVCGVVKLRGTGEGHSTFERSTDKIGSLLRRNSDNCLKACLIRHRLDYQVTACCYKIYESFKLLQLNCRPT